jgi:GxxExxY protein
MMVPWLGMSCCGVPSSRIGLLHEPVTRIVLGAFFEVYNKLGPGFLESVYGAAMEHVLRRRGLHVEREVMVVVYLDDTPIARQRMDMLVAGVVILEHKASAKFPHGATRQLKDYLTATKLEVGLILNFGDRPEFKRVIRTNNPL